MTELENMVEEMCKIIDGMAELELTPGTPIHDCQQSLIAGVRRYRKDKESQTTICEHSGLEWDSNGKLIGVNP